MELFPNENELVSLVIIDPVLLITSYLSAVIAHSKSNYLRGRNMHQAVRRILIFERYGNVLQNPETITCRKNVGDGYFYRS